MTRTFDAGSRRMLLALCLGASSLFAAPMAALAADPVPAAEPARDKLAMARAMILQERWRDAIAALQQVGDTGNADWNNLMGYSHRKAKTPDYAAAERYYDAALRIDPKHRGALEYSGELYLMMGDLPKAEERLARLDKACTFGCDELRDLRAAISAFKANGNRMAAKP
jgi:tetratricopeptide (TPR) repeat protein